MERRITKLTSTILLQLLFLEPLIGLDHAHVEIRHHLTAKDVVLAGNTA
jgi:hypothetical protein